MENKMIKQRIKVLNDKIDEFLINDYTCKFKFSENDIEYIRINGMINIKSEVKNIIKKRMASDFIFFDGMQTPEYGNPIYIAQHATGTCCRRCLYKNHGILIGKRLSSNEINYIILLIITWIEKQLVE